MNRKYRSSIMGDVPGVSDWEYFDVGVADVWTERNEMFTIELNSPTVPHFLIEQPCPPMFAMSFFKHYPPM